MSEQRFQIQPGLPTASVVMIILAALCGGLYFATSQIEWALAALLPAALALVTWRTGHACEVDIRESGLEISDPPHTIRWEAIEAVQVGNATYPATAKLPNRPLLLLVNGGWIKLAGRVTPSLSELYRTILDNIPEGGSRAIPRKLASFLDEQLQTFGEDRVWSFAGRRRAKVGARRATFFGLAMFVVGLVWLVHEVNHHRDATPLGVLGGIMMVIGLVTFLASFAVDGSTSPRLVKKPEECGVVISPKAFAMIQGPLAGTLRWDEIRKISYGQATRGVALGSMVLHLDGALLTVFDIYDRPLAQIHELVMKYWDHEA